MTSKLSFVFIRFCELFVIKSDEIKKFSSKTVLAKSYETYIFSADSGYNNLNVTLGALWFINLSWFSFISNIISKYILTKSPLDLVFSNSKNFENILIF